MSYLLSIIIGFITATCGAWKDTLFEPFSIFKYFRSPIVISLCYLFTIHLYPHSPSLLIAASSSALERLSIESWKAILRKPPGKFMNKDRDTNWLIKRLRKSEWISLILDWSELK